MKKVILLACFLPLQASAQICENFESGILSNWVQGKENHWLADTTFSLSGNFSLHHIFDNPDAGTDQIGVSLSDLHPDEGVTRWSFLLRYGYEPSAANNWSVFLMSDTEPAVTGPGGNTHGFAVGVNLSGSDDTLRLWKINGALISTIISSRINWQNDIGTGKEVKIVVERSPDGEWALQVLQVDNTVIDTSYGTDATLFNIGWFGVFYRYSSTRDRLLWLDEINIEGDFYKDDEPPVIAGYEVKSKNCIQVVFSEEPSAGSVLPANFLLNEQENISASVIKESSISYRIVFSSSFINKGTNTLLIKRICDIYENCSENTIISFIPAFAEPGDVVITEIMADPNPVVSLPAREYLELHNRTDFPFNMKKWMLSAGSSSEIFPDTIIPAKGYLIICTANDTLSFRDFGHVLGIDRLPALNDTRMALTLSDSSGMLIHGTEYTSVWYGDVLKETGGWALEMVDTKYPFHTDGNWKASVSRNGGTPGIENSVSGYNRDDYFKGILNVFPEDSNSINLDFSETVPAVVTISNLKLSEGRSLTEVATADLLLKSFYLKINEPLERGKIYLLKTSDDITDFAGNRMDRSEFFFGLTEMSMEADLMFNELLFNPLSGDVDYIEIYNNSKKIIDASRIYLVGINDDSGDTSSVIQLTEEKRCILPGTYYSVTTDKEKVIDRYFSADPDYIFQIPSLPALNDDKGHLILYNRELDQIDEVFYDEKMHYSLLDMKEGISLEKVKPDYPSIDRSAWHSASESSGWGTPGAPNSAEIPESELEEEVVLSSTKITPDNDGYEDVLSIDFRFAGNGSVISVTIFDETGSLVRMLTDKLLAAPETSIIWDGTSDDGMILNTGIYIIYIEIFNPTGAVQKIKKVCTVIRTP